MTRDERPPTVRIEPSVSGVDLAAVVDQAVAVLDDGGTIVVPTDTVYGVAARLDRPSAIERLFDLKDRDRSKPLAVLVADRVQARELIDPERVPDGNRNRIDRLMDRGWPGALTLVLPRAGEWSHVDLGGDSSTIGVRCPHAQVVRDIAGRVGPLVTTSANRSGEATPSTASAAARSLAGSVGLVIDAGPCTEPPSTVIDVSGQPFRLIRGGSFDVATAGVDVDA